MSEDAAKACSHVPEQGWAGIHAAASHWPHGWPLEAGSAAQVALPLAGLWVALLASC